MITNTEHGWVVSDGGVWLPGTYESASVAQAAVKLPLKDLGAYWEALDPKRPLTQDDLNKIRNGPVSKMFTYEEVLLIDQQARAYGWEIGKGAEIVSEVLLSEDNPFNDRHWRDKHGLPMP